MSPIYDDRNTENGKSHDEHNQPPIPTTMQAAQYYNFKRPIHIVTLPTPILSEPHKESNNDQGDDIDSDSNAILLQVKATGVCRSDWHGWKGHDSDIVEHGLPFTPGHECSGIIVQVGSNVTKLKVGQKVVVPFILSCGSCRECHCHRPTVCEKQMQPGFTMQGSFAEFVRIPRADRNVCVLPDEGVDFIEAAALGCRFTTAYRAVVQQGLWEDSLKSAFSIHASKRDLSVANNENACVCAVFGCGGLGLSCIMVANAILQMLIKNFQVKNPEQALYPVQIIAIDVSQRALQTALELGATDVIDASQYKYDSSIREKIFHITDGKGADVSIDAAGFPSTCENAVHCTRRGGRMVQVGLPIDTNKRKPIVPMGAVAGKEIEIVGSHGFAAMDMPLILDLVKRRVLQPSRLVHEKVNLREGAKAIEDMDFGSPLGITMITQFEDKARL